MKNFMDEFIKELRKTERIAYRKKQIKYIRKKRQTFFYYFENKYFRKSIFLIDKNLFI